MSNLLIATQNYIINQTDAYITDTGFPQVITDAGGLASLSNPRANVAPTYRGALEISGSYSDSPSKRNSHVRLMNQWVWQLLLKFPHMVSLEEFKDFLSVDFRVPKDYQTGTNPAIFLFMEDFLVSHPVEVQGSSGGTEARFSFRGWLRPR